MVREVMERAAYPMMWDAGIILCVHVHELRRICMVTSHTLCSNHLVNQGSRSLSTGNCEYFVVCSCILSEGEMWIRGVLGLAV